MEAMRSGDFDVFAYESILHTRSPLLRWIYCESHALEPFAAFGSSARQGEYRFPNVLWVEHRRREALLDRIFGELTSTPGWALDVERRFEGQLWALLRSLGRARRRPTASTIDVLLRDTTRYLSVGVFKEALSDEGLEVFFGQFVPASRIRPLLAPLWQPRCVPHFLKFELRALFAAERLQHGRPRALELGIERTAHHSRFLVEDTPFHSPSTFLRHLEELGATAGRRGVRALRLRRLAEHHRARARASRAEAAILDEVERFGRHTLEVKLRLHAMLRFVRFVATAEELKHVLTVEAARICRKVMDSKSLEIESTSRDVLLGALGGEPDRIRT